MRRFYRNMDEIYTRNLQFQRRLDEVRIKPGLYGRHTFNSPMVHPSPKNDGKGSLHFFKNKRDWQELRDNNLQMARRIINCRPVISTATFEKQYQAMRSLQKSPS
jgi:hypothetical protein